LKFYLKNLHGYSKNRAIFDKNGSVFEKKKISKQGQLAGYFKANRLFWQKGYQYANLAYQKKRWS